MENYAYALVVIGWVNIFFAIYTWQAAKNSQAVKFFAGSLLSVGLWGIGLAGFLGTNDPTIALYWAKFHYVASIYVAYFVLLFALALSGSKKISFLKQTLLHIPILIVSGITIFSNALLLKSVVIETTGNIALLYKPGHVVYGIVFVIYYLIALVVVLVKVFKTIGVAQKQMIIVFSGLFLTGILGAVFNLILPILGNYKLIWVGPLFTIMFLGITLGGILKYQLFNIRLLAGKVSFIIGSSFVIWGTFTSFFYLNKVLFESYWSWEALIFNIIAAVVFVIFYEKYKVFLQQKIQTSIINPGFDSSKVLQAYNMTLAKVVLKSDVLRSFADTIRQTIRPSYLSVVIEENGEIFNNQYVEYKNIDYKTIFQIVKSNSDLMTDYISLTALVSLIQTHTSKVSPDIENLAENMQKDDLHLLIPIVYDGKLLAICLLGKRDANNSTYIEDEIVFLSSLASTTGISLTRAVLYEKVEELNQTLQSKVDAQTKELKVKVEQLQEARRKENDMIDIMGHELRTPATIVKLNAVLLDRFNNDITTDPEAYKRYVGRIKMAVENEIKLINTLLTSAKLEGDKIVIDPEEVNIQNEIDMSLHGNEKDAKDRYLELINKTDPKTPTIYADRARIIEILNNLISNGIKYTEKGSVTVETKYDEDWVTVSILDTGKGIPQEDIPKLGHKFYRVSNYTETSEENKIDVVRPGGTGLGLYVTFNLIKKMGGDIKIESELGKGSKFIFTIPRYKGQDGNKPKNQSMDMFERLGLKK